MKYHFFIYRFLAFVCSCIILLPNSIAARSLSLDEQKIEIFLQSKKEEQIALLQRLVDINSGTENISGVKRVGEILRPQFEQLGFKTYWQLLPAEMQRAPTLIAEHKGHSKEKILLIGHLDTVFPENSPFQKFERHGNSATGPGVIDDKGGDVVILYALKALQSVHALDDADITVVLTGDEEDSGKPTSISRKPLFEAAKGKTIALDFEWATTPDTATIARRGVASWLLTTQGKDAHSSEIFQNSAGDGAIFEVARILNTMRAQLSTEKYLSFNPGIILGGNSVDYQADSAQGFASGKNNVIAKTALVRGDLRFLSEQQKIAAEQKIIAIVNAHLPETNATIQFQDGIPAMSPTAANENLLKAYSRESEDLGYGSVKPLDPGLRGAADISHIANLVKANLAGLGAEGSGAHSVREKLVIDSLTRQTARAALLIYWALGQHGA